MNRPKEPRENQDWPDAELEASMRERPRPGIPTSLRANVLQAAQQRMAMRSECEVLPVQTTQERAEPWRTAAVAAAVMLMFGAGVLLRNDGHPSVDIAQPETSMLRVDEAVVDWTESNDPIEENLMRARFRAGLLLPSDSGLEMDPLRMRLGRMNRFTERLEAHMDEFTLPAEGSPEQSGQLQILTEREVG